MVTLVICLLVLVVASAAVLHEGLDRGTDKRATATAVPHREARPQVRRRRRGRPATAERLARTRPPAVAPPAVAQPPRRQPPEPSTAKAAARPSARPAAPAAAPPAHRARSGALLVVVSAGVGVLTAAAVAVAVVAMALALRSAVGA